MTMCTTPAPVLFVVGAGILPDAARMLETHLAIARRRGLISIVLDTACPPELESTAWHAAAWQAEQCHSAAITVLLMSAGSLAAVDPEQLASASKRLIPVVVHQCGWQESPTLARLAPLPRDGKPALASDEAWTSVAREILAVATLPRA